MQARRRFDRSGSGTTEWLDVLLYLPLFVQLHQHSLAHNPLATVEPFRG